MSHNGNWHVDQQGFFIEINSNCLRFKWIELIFSDSAHDIIHFDFYCNIGRLRMFSLQV